MPVQVEALVLRLRNAPPNAPERLTVLNLLQTLSKQDAMECGKYALPVVLAMLEEGGPVEEFQEMLDLVYRLVQSIEKSPSPPSSPLSSSPLTSSTRAVPTAASIANTELVLQKGLEYMINLLDHTDMIVGITTSQILTEMHINCPDRFEKALHDCPTGMMILLQRLPDDTKEEVRNQIIVLINQMTATNEEMKKTVVFNEGFDVLFGIIEKEGGAKDAGSHVIRDCLQIVSNILYKSETCQRLFFDMGGSVWYNKLAEFFHPTILEDPIQGFDSPSKKMSCRHAMIALFNALESVDIKTNNRLGDSTHEIMSSVCFWLSRRSPMDLMEPARNLMNQIIFNLNIGTNLKFLKNGSDVTKGTDDRKKSREDELVNRIAQLEADLKDAKDQSASHAVDMLTPSSPHSSSTSRTAVLSPHSPSRIEDIDQFFSTFQESWDVLADITEKLAHQTSPDAVEMIAQIGLQASFQQEGDKFNLLREKLLVLESILQECVNSQELLANTCSDMAEGVGLSLEEPEGSSMRIRECTEKLTLKVHEMFNELDQAVSHEDYMAAQDEIYRLNDTVASLELDVHAARTSEQGYQGGPPSRHEESRTTDINNNESIHHVADVELAEVQMQRIADLEQSLMESELAAQEANEELKNLSEEYTTLVSQLKGQVADEGQKVALEADLKSTRQALEEAQSALEVNIKSNKENVDKLQHELMDSHIHRENVEVQNTELMTQIEKLGHQLMEVNEKSHSSANAAANDTAYHKKMYESKLSEKEKLIEELRLEVDSLGCQVSEYIDCVEGLEGEIKDKDDEVIRLKAVVDETKEQMLVGGNLAETIEEKENEVKTLETLIADYKEREENGKEQHLELKNVIDSLRQELKDKDDKIHEANVLLEECREDHEKTKTLNKLVEEKEKEIGRMAHTLSEEQLIEAKAKVVSLQNDVDSLQSENKYYVDRLGTLQMQIDSLEKDVADKEETIRLGTIETASRNEQNNAESLKYKEKLIEMEEMVQQRERELKEKENEMSDFSVFHQKEIEKMNLKIQTKAREDREVTEATLSSLRHEIDERDSILENYKKMHADNEIRIIDLQNVVESLTNENNEYLNEVRDWKKLNANLESDVEKLQKELSVARNNTDVTGEIARLTGQISKLSIEVSSLEGALRKKDQEMINIVQDRAVTSGELSGLKLSFNSLNEEIGRLKKEKLSLERRLDSKQGNQDGYFREVDDAMLKVKAKEKQLSRVLGDIECLIDTVCSFAMWVNRSVNSSEQADSCSRESLKALEEAIASKQIKADHIPAIMDTLKGIIDGYFNLLKRSASRGSNGSRTPRSSGSPSPASSVMMRPISPPSSPVHMGVHGQIHTNTLPSPSRWQCAQENVNADTKTLANLLSNLNKKTKQIEDMKQREMDILSMLAQQELELNIFKDKILEFCGQSTLVSAQADVKLAAISKYGGYIEFHENMLR